MTRDQESANNHKSREQIIIRTGWISCLLNAAFAALKFIIGSVSHSVAITTDAMNNLSDSVSSVVTILGTRVAEKKPTAKHPLGYGRVEYLTALVIAVTIIVAGYEFFKTSYLRILHPVFSTVTWLQIVLLTATVLGKIFMYRLDMKNGKKYRSQALIASGRDALNDSLSTTLTIAAALAAVLWKIDIDGWVGLIISVMIIWSGFQSLMDATGSILGRPASSDTAGQIRKIILSCPPIIGAYDLVMNSIGPENMRGTIEVEVPDDTNAEEASGAMTRAQKEIQERLGIHLTFGLHVVNYGQPEIAPIYRKVCDAVLTAPEVCAVHGFRCRTNPLQAEFIVSVRYSDCSEKQIRTAVEESLKRSCPEIEASFEIDFTDFCTDKTGAVSER